MKVRELIQELETEDPEAEVTLWAGGQGYRVGDLCSQPDELEIQAGEELELA